MNKRLLKKKVSHSTALGVGCDNDRIDNAILT